MKRSTYDTQVKKALELYEKACIVLTDETDVFTDKKIIRETIIEE